MIARLAIATLLAALCGSARAGVEYRFTGELIQDPRTGFTVIGEKKDGIVAVTSARHHYSLVLPWGDDWKLTADEDGALLKGTSGLVNLTLSVAESDEPPERFLRSLQARLKDSGQLKGVEKSEVVTFRKEPVLRILVDAEAASGRREFRGVKMVHVHAAERVGNVVYLLHLSRVIPAEEARAFDDKLLLSFATVGFRADFMREPK